MGIELFCEIEDVLNYATVYNGAHVIRKICLKNTSEADFENLLVTIKGSSQIIEEKKIYVEKIAAGEELLFKNIELVVHAENLAAMTERSSASLTVCVQKEEKELASETKNITLLAYDQWPGLLYTPELLTAFSMPNHPVVVSTIQAAAKYLEKWTGNPSLSGYQTGDPNRVKNMAAAVYAAIQQKNITYATAPSSFEEFGQRVRLVDMIEEYHLGNCMDMTLYYVACLEAIGLNPIMVLMKGHIFAGVWLRDQSFSEMIMDDPTQIEKRMSKGIRELLVVECTAMCSGATRNFDEAVKYAERNVSVYRDFSFAIDVRRARSMGIRPLPTRIKGESGFRIVHEERRESEVTQAPKNIGETFILEEREGQEKATKETQWERKLLDLSLRNMLINMRMTKAIVPLLSPDLAILEDALSDGEEFQVQPRPAEMSIAGDGGVPVEALGDLGSFQDYIVLESRHKRLHSLYSEQELNSSLTKMYRTARTSMEENGASTLYLALGLLRWFERNDDIARYAPLVLLPIDIVRKSANKGYAMHMRDEDAQINITLLEFLKQSYDLQIYGLSTPPTDEHGLDLAKIFAMVRHAVVNLPMWDVVEAGFIGNFSFSQFVMWNDIHTHKDFLKQNKIVRSLMKGAVDWDCSIPESVDSEDAYLPVSADSSQLRAINMAAEGASFVLHGPPGTGKSQTITAMIANALTKGKTVLFVAEKMAALQVVQKRLAALGIQDFCLELHSNKATKKAVLDQLSRTLEAHELDSKTDYDQKITEIRMMRKELDAYVEALHEKRECGESLRALMDQYEAFPESSYDIRFEHSYVLQLTKSDLERQKHCVEQLVAAGREIGHPHNHPLAMIRKTEYSQSLKFDQDDLIKEYQSVLGQYEDTVKEFAAQMECRMPTTAKEWNEVLEHARSIAVAGKLPGFLKEAANIAEVFSRFYTYQEKQKQFAEKQSAFKRLWNENFLRMDMESFRQKYDQANKKFIGKRRALSMLTSEIQAYAFVTIEQDKIPMYLTDVSFYQQEAKEMQIAENSFSPEEKEFLQNYHDRDSLKKYEAFVRRELQIMEQIRAKIDKLETNGQMPACVQNAERMVRLWNSLNQSEEKVVKQLDLEIEHGNENWMGSRKELCRCILENAALIKNQIIYNQLVEKCCQLGLQEVCTAYESGIPHEELVSAYQKSIYRELIIAIVEREPVLNEFTGAGFEERILQFKKLDQEFMDLTRKEMVYKLTSQLPTSYEDVQVSKELNILRRAISSNGRGVSIRSLFEQIPHILSRLCPCMLMSPISVAQYLQAENDLFDIVIFDEASQLPTCKAVGVLARGKNAVIVGDPNQMPPTSFFAGNTVDEDNLDIEDLDSILDDCLALGMPQSYLHWHYRSRHESLIAFSNHEFYENAMFTFPSVNERERRVNLVKVEGFFDRGKGRVNVGEAKAIVAEVKRRYQDADLRKQSIGVVTFNTNQQVLIEDLLLEEYRKDLKFDQWANTGDEALFVKNLENVQGDERDVILFSIAFGPNEEGKLSLNFGPLNKNGGWKRLNVAVSRARSEMLVFTTMTADMIELRRTKSKGVEALKNFLDFAERGLLQNESRNNCLNSREGIKNRICMELSAAGYKYQTDVGHSKYKMDIAVLNPYNDKDYLLGIMLDGESYRQSKNTKDREVSQLDILRGLGWNLYRIWTLDWWDNREKEIQELLKVLDEKKADAALCAETEAGPEKKQEPLTEAEPEKEQEPLEETEPLEEQESFVPSEPEAESETLVGMIDTRKSVTDVPINSILDSIVCDNKTENSGKISAEKTEEADGQAKLHYRVVRYQAADTNVTAMAAAEYVKKENAAAITEKMQEILDAEAPIAYERLVKKTLRSFDISRSSQQTLEATDRAFKKVSAKFNRQSGMKFYWRKDQVPEQYEIYRNDALDGEKRSGSEICQQEIKNAVCVTLEESGPMEKEALLKAVIRTMGYGRSSAALLEAAERGLQYGRKTGEIQLNSEKKFCLKESK